MARRRYDDEPDNHDRWIVSYVDFITLLFAFFVVMYAVSSVNEGKYRDLSSSLGMAFGAKPAAPVVRPELAVPQPVFPLKKRGSEQAMKREREAMTQIARDLQKLLAPLLRDGKVRVTQSARGVSIEINASVLFAPGEARLSSESDAALKVVAGVLREDTHAIQVEGHTDDVPISGPLYPSNWELSAVRAGRVVRLFIDSGVDGRRLTAVGHGANQPVAPNDTPEGRARNRRVAITILSSLPEPAAEVPLESAQRGR
jgi:chemotaxis protein MotB